MTKWRINGVTSYKRNWHPVFKKDIGCFQLFLSVKITIDIQQNEELKRKKLSFDL